MKIKSTARVEEVGKVESHRKNVDKDLWYIKKNLKGFISNVDVTVQGPLSSPKLTGNFFQVAIGLVDFVHVIHSVY